MDPHSPVQRGPPSRGLVGKGANLYGEMISTSSSAISGLQWLIRGAQDPAKRPSCGLPVDCPWTGRRQSRFNCHEAKIARAWEVMRRLSSGLAQTGEVTEPSA